MVIRCMNLCVTDYYKSSTRDCLLKVSIRNLLKTRGSACKLCPKILTDYVMPEVRSRWTQCIECIDSILFNTIECIDFRANLGVVPALNAEITPAVRSMRHAE